MDENTMMDIDANESIGGRSHAGAGSSSDASLTMTLHRLRFVDWKPSNITALSFSPSPNKRAILAVGRENGDIDLCTWVQEAGSGHAKGWLVETTLLGALNSKIESLHFVVTPNTSTSGDSRHLRLFSTSGGSLLTEHFLPPSLPGLSPYAPLASSSKHLTRTLPSTGGVIWSLAPSPLGTHLALGCDDSIVRFVSIADGAFDHVSAARQLGPDGLPDPNAYAPRCDRGKGRILSLAWGPPVRTTHKKRAGKEKAAADSDSSSDESSSSEGEDDAPVSRWRDTFILGGTSRSSALIWDVHSGRTLSRLSVEKSRGEASLVWSCLVLADGTPILADSTGRVTFFDASTHVPLPGCSFRAHGKGADVLALCAGPDGRTVYSSSVDQKIAEYVLIAGSSAHDRGKWVFAATRRLHAHDVRALAIDPPFNMLRAVSLRKSSDSASPYAPAAPLAPERLPILASAGADFTLVLTPACPASSIGQAPSEAGNTGKTARARRRRAKKGGEVLEAARSQPASIMHINPISSSVQTTFADSVHRRTPFVPGSSRAGSSGGGAVACICAAKRWIVLRREGGIGIWAMGGSGAADASKHRPEGHEAWLGTDLVDGDEDKGALAQPQWTKLLEMQLRTHGNLDVISVSPDGRFLALSDAWETKLFELVELTGSSEVELTPRRVKLSAAFSSSLQTGESRPAPSATALTFTPDSTRLVLATRGTSVVHVISLPASRSSEQPTLLCSFAQHQTAHAHTAQTSDDEERAVAGLPSNGHTSRVNGQSAGDSINGDASHASVKKTALTAPIVLALVSPDAQYLLTTDALRRTHLFHLDTLRHARALPSTSHVPTGACFLEGSTGAVALLLLPSGAIEAHETERGAAGGKGSNLHVLLGAVKEKLTSVREPAVGLCWVKQEGSAGALVVWGQTFIVTARMEEAAPAHTGTANGKVNGNGDVASAALKRRRSRNMGADLSQQNGETEAASHHTRTKVRITFKYQPLLLVGKVDAAAASGPTVQGKTAEELVVVERPFFALAAELPSAYRRAAKYGT